ncbi:TonB-dependent receptor domain-containing protein [Thalassotalea sp. PLHSN55]|uniref:TonB-dependent receptor domain-containing protein n=1 Tax=Thalassotalea sp. PLHSN55 TaxID=3435888 RepID=UPI003F84EC46
MKFQRNILSLAVRASLLSVLAVPSLAWADQTAEIERKLNSSEQQQAEATTQQEAEEEIERIVTTGTRIHKADLESANPITIISAEDMMAAGNITVFDALADLSQNSGLVGGDENTASFTPNAKVLNLRGFGPQYTLVLINGQRLASYPQPYGGSSTVLNVDTIPAAAVKQIEILTTGASAIYGSDAVAGVVNIILKDNIEETTVSAMIGGSEDTGNLESGRVQLTTGFDLGDGNITVMAEVFKQEAVFGRDREAFDHANDYPYIDMSDSGGRIPYLLGGAIELDMWRRYGYDMLGSDLPSYTDPGQEACDNIPNMEYKERLPVEGTAPGSWGNYCGLNTAEYATLQNEKDKAALIVTGNYDIGSDVTAFGTLMLTDTTGKSDRGYLSLSGAVMPKYSEPNILPFKGFNGSFLKYPDYHVIQRIFTNDEIGDTANTTDERLMSFNAGLEGEIGEFMWKLNATESRYELEGKRLWIKEEQAQALYLGQDTGTTLLGEKVYDGTGALSVFDVMPPSAVNSMFGYATNKNQTSTTVLSAELTGSIYTLPAGDIQAAFVAEYVNETFDYIPDQRAQNKLDGQGNTWRGLGAVAGNGERARQSAAAELYIPISEQVNATFALRYDTYDSGTSSSSGQFTPAASIEYRPADNILARASYSKIFKAPDMQSVFTTSNGYSSGRDYIACYEQFASQGVTPEEFANGPDSARYLSSCRSTQFNIDIVPSDELKNETGESYGIGLFWEPIDGLDVTWDYFSVEINDQVQTASVGNLLWEEFVCAYEPNDQIITYGCDKVNELINRIDSDGLNGQGTEISDIDTSPFNLAMYSQSGFDTKLAYRFELEDWIPGQFSARLSHTKILSTKYDNIAGDDEQPIEFSNSIYSMEAQDRLTAALTYVNEDYSITYSVRYSAPIGPRSPDLVRDEFGNVQYFDEAGNTIPYIEDPESGIMVDVDGNAIATVGQARTSQSRLDAYVVANLTASYYGDNWRVSFTVNNLHNAKAPSDDSYLYHQAPWYNTSAYPGAGLGRQMYLNASYEF